MISVRNIKILFLIIGLSLIFIPSAEARSHHHHKVRHPASLVDRSASYADIVIDAETGQVLHATNPDSLRHPASLSKMMTLYLTFQAIENGRLGLNQYLPISSNAAEQPPSKLGLRPGGEIRVEDAILGLVTESANDAAVVIAEALGGSEAGFGTMMTRQARALGMVHSHFDNPSGLPDPDQVTTARDMAMLGHALIYHFPQYYPYFDREGFTYAGIYHHNHNHLKDRYDGMDGIKTGYIRASGFNLVASAKRGSTRLIGVVFGGHTTTSRDNRMAELLDDAFDAVRYGHGETHLANVVLPEPQGDASDEVDAAGYMKVPAKNAAPSVQAMLPASPPPVSVAPATAAPAVPALAPTPVPTPQAPPQMQLTQHVNNVQIASAPQALSPQTLPVPVKKHATKTSVSQTAKHTAKKTGDGSWGIQIGAFGDPAIGQAALANTISNLPQYLSDADPVIQKISSGGVIMYRARLMSMDKDDAEQACEILAERGQSCLTVGP